MAKEKFEEYVDSKKQVQEHLVLYKGLLEKPLVHTERI